MSQSLKCCSFSTSVEFATFFPVAQAASPARPIGRYFVSNSDGQYPNRQKREGDFD
jgi:hypothetical protein